MQFLFFKTLGDPNLPSPSPPSKRDVGHDRLVNLKQRSFIISVRKEKMGLAFIWIKLIFKKRLETRKYRCYN